MSQFVPTPSDELPIPPVPASQSNNDQSSLTHTRDDVSVYAGKHSFCSMGIADRILAQSQRDFALVERSLSLAMQPMTNTNLFAAAMAPRVSLPPIWFTKYVAMPKVAPLNIMPHAFDTSILSRSMRIEHQLQSQLRPVHVAMEDLRARVSAFSSAVKPFQEIGAVVSSSIINMGSIAQSFRSILPSSEIFTLSAMTLPTLSIMNQLSSITSFFPDISWVAALTDHINLILTTLPHWPSLDLQRLKERIKQRLVAAFRYVGLCFAHPCPRI